MKPTKDDLLEQGYIEVYNCLWPPNLQNPAAIESRMVLGEHGEHKADGFLGQAEHFRRFITIVMGHEQCDQPFIWNPNAKQITDDYFDHQWNSFVGHGSSSKSRTIAAIAVAEFLLKPKDTSCLITSTNIPDGKKRVWADVERCWFDACTYFGGEDVMPGELVSSIAIIRYIDRASGYKAQNRGLALVPSKEDESQAGIGRMKGFKSPRLRMFVDEASDISWKIIEAAESNLETGAMTGPDGRKDFRVAVTLNANEKEDTGGKLCCPLNEKGEDDWKAVDTAMAVSWKTKRGHCRRFSAEDSPNVVLAREGKCGEWEEPFPGLISLGLLNAQRDRMGNGSPNFQRQYLAIWPEGGVDPTIYTKDEIEHHGCHQKVTVRRELIERLWGFDPAFTHDGDRAPLVWVDLIRDDQGRMVAEYGGVMWMDDGMNPQKDPNIQIRDNLVSTLTAKGVNPRNFAMDATGAGRTLAGFIKEKWPGGNGMLEIVFNEKATDRPVSAFSSKTGYDLYSNKMTEMWLVAKELMMSGQIKGLTDNVIKELTGRQYDKEKSGKDERGRVKIEETRIYRKRLGRSPDEASAVLVALQLARERHSLLASIRPKTAPKPGVVTSESPYDWSKLEKNHGKGLRGRAQKILLIRNMPTSV
jgi:hypothetical protein